jgi:O-antigen/teichoic acid export membrane protein
VPKDGFCIKEDKTDFPPEVIVVSVAQRIIKNAVYISSSSFTVMALTVVYTVLCARYFGVEGYGVYAFSLSLIMLISAFSRYGLEFIAVREVAKDRSKVRKYLSNISAIKMLFAVVLLSLVSAYLFATGQPLERQVVVFVFVSSSFFIMLAEGFRWSFQAFQVMEYESFLKVLQSSLLLVSLLAIVYFRLGIIFFAMAYLLVSIIVAVFCFYFTVSRVSKFRLEFDFPFIKKIVLGAIPLGMMFVFSAFYLNVDNILISTIRSDVETGWYSAAYKLMSYVRVLLAYYLLVVYPAFSHLGKTSVKGAFIELFNKSFYLLLMVTLPISVGTFLLSGRIITLFFGQGFSNSTQALNILIWALPIVTIGGLFAYALISIGKQLICAFATFVGLLVNLGVDLALIPKHGFMGAAYGILAAEIVVLLIILYLNERHIKFRPQFLELIKVALAVLGMSFLTYFLRDAALYYVIPASAFSYLVLLLMFKAVTREDLLMIIDSFRAREKVADTVEYEQV